MKIALLQTAGAGSVSGNLDLLEAKAAEAAGQGARLLIAPELFLTGYNIGARTRELAERAGGPAASRAAEIAARQGLALLFGFPEAQGDEVYNAVLFVDRDAARAVYRKAHLFGPGERTHFARGPGRPPLIELDGLKVGLLICYDVEFPEAVRALAVEGAELIAVPTALMAPYSIVADTVVPARAYENGVFLAYVNRVGTEGDLTYVGRSALVGPDGAELCRADAESETLMTVEIDRQSIARLREINPYLADLRRDLYP
ncbi:carbon-nitrogen hydrolase family protein [Algihabitans albus]|uniref:carbon-nitrogen hydrolase family protein n=1 Tax=Algihabitans albus TaxID=2164067 RepID=UPI000E5CD495|nr:carbon-nitrogen hydrolase family protein [Algihabitans albus]